MKRYGTIKHEGCADANDNVHLLLKLTIAKMISNTENMVQQAREAYVIRTIK